MTYPFKPSLNQKTTHYWDGHDIVAETNATDVLKATYLRGAGALIAQVIGTDTFYYLHNAHGDVVQRISENGTSAPKYKYDAFGNERNLVVTDPNPFRYCGEYYDAELQEIYLRARSYDPSTGRFSQEDPAKDTNNWYSYTNHNPVNFTDPSGMIMVGEGGSSSKLPIGKQPAKKPPVTRSPEPVTTTNNYISGGGGSLFDPGATYPGIARPTSSGYEVFSQPVNYTSSPNAPTGFTRSPQTINHGPHDTIIEAVMEFTTHTYATSYYTQHEIGATIYQINGSDGYFISSLSYGSPHRTLLITNYTFRNRTAVAVVHNHPALEGPSLTDVEGSIRAGLPCYVATSDYMIWVTDSTGGYPSVIESFTPIPLSSYEKGMLILEYSDSWYLHQMHCLDRCRYINQWPYK